MAAPSKGSKNDIKNRGRGARKKQIDGKVVIPIQYKGDAAGHGSYIAARFEESGQLAKDAQGRPIPYQLV